MLPPLTRAIIRTDQGMALIEALVAAAVLAMGLTGAGRLTLRTLQAADDTRERGVAQALAMDAMECLQAAQPQCALAQVQQVSGTTYTLHSQTRPRGLSGLTDIEVQVQWAERQSSMAPNRGTAGATDGQNLVVLHSSRDAVPAWVGVSLP